ncbi:hypothetical protein L596_023593 [Steinernema carpocapsae]|uniref:Cullin family profile domain-containing protein n=1 Tax=Steinernema carpocapsae TaxID=34508 RepID=A0A4U5ME57_STECR|nr:hypothetical protein L596_023593 [Steinernema carpocapsae]
MAELKKNPEELLPGCLQMLRDMFERSILTSNSYQHIRMVVQMFHMQKELDNEDFPPMGSGRSMRIFRVIRDYIREFVRKKAEELIAIESDDERLTGYKDFWTDYQWKSRCANSICSYLNNHWVLRYLEHYRVIRQENLFQNEDQVHYMYTLCMVIWKEEMLANQTLNIVESAKNLLRCERDGEKIETVKIAKLVESFVEVGIEYERVFDNSRLYQTRLDYREVDEFGLTTEQREMLKTYEDLFETPILEDTRAYYRIEAKQASIDGDIIKYMRMANERWEQEAERSKRCLHNAITGYRIQKEVDAAWVEEQLPFFQSHFNALLKAERRSDLLLMFKLCLRVDVAIEQLRKDFCEYVALKGREAISGIPVCNQNDPKSYVEAVLKVRDHYESMVEESFGNDCGFVKFFFEGCVAFVNRNCITEKNKKHSSHKSCELLGRYVDLALKKGGEDSDTFLEKVIVVFHHLEDKDIFQKYFNRFLARRLIMEQSGSDDLEINVISRLKALCGHEYTSTAQKMFHDIEVSRQLTAGFKEVST